MVEKGECILTHGLHCTHIYTITYNPQLNVTHKFIINRFLIISLVLRVWMCVLYACELPTGKKQLLFYFSFCSNCPEECVHESLSHPLRAFVTRSFRGGEKSSSECEFSFFLLLSFCFYCEVCFFSPVDQEKDRETVGINGGKTNKEFGMGG